LDTVYSLSGDVPAIDDSLEEADLSVLQPGSIVVGTIRQICSIRKISAGGAVLHVDMPVADGDRLELELDDGHHLDGTIVWRSGAEVGLRFDESIDVLPILARNLASQPGERRRMPRVEIACPALLETGSRAELVTTRDIAQGGAKIETTLPLEPEQKITITPEGLRPIEAVVRWTRGSTTGIAFQPELGWQELMPWLRARRDAPPAHFAPAPSPEGTAGAAAAPPEPGTSVQLNLPARVREGMRRWSIEVAALSTRTVEFESFAPLRLGTLLWIVLPGLEGWPARIIAIDGYRFTCEFTQPLHPAVLERILGSAGAELPLSRS
jgi:hypothetical protein